MRCAANITPESAAVAANPQMRIPMISLAVWVIGSRGPRLVERRRRRDEAHVGERLREVADRLLRGPLHLLGEEADIVRVAAEPLEAALRPFVLAGVGEVLDRP